MDTFSRWESLLRFLPEMVKIDMENFIKRLREEENVARFVLETLYRIVSLMSIAINNCCAHFFYKKSFGDIELPALLCLMLHYLKYNAQTYNVPLVVHYKFAHYS